MNPNDQQASERRLFMTARIIRPEYGHGKPVIKYSICTDDEIALYADSKVGTLDDLDGIAAQCGVKRGDKSIESESLTIAEAFEADRLGWLLDGEPRSKAPDAQGAELLSKAEGKVTLITKNLYARFYSRSGVTIGESRDSLDGSSASVLIFPEEIDRLIKYLQRVRELSR